MSKLIPKHLTPNQPLVLSQDNTRVESPYIESIPITETNLYKQYLADPYKNSDFNTWKKRQELIQSNKKDEKVKADKRAPIVKKQESEQGKAIYNQQQRKEQEAKNNKLIWTGIGLGGLALVQATPAAPWLDAAFATHGALGLAEQANKGTLGLNLETGLHALEMTPLALKGIGKTGKRLITQADNYITNSTNPKMLYVRYYLTGPLKFGSEVELPVLYRRTPKLSMQSGMSKKFIVTPPKNRFMFKDGTPSPVITNFTTDHPVIPNNGGDWTGITVHSFPGKILLGKNVISTRPQDTFTYGDIITVPKKQVKSIYIGENGAGVTTIPESQLTLYIRENFRTPTEEDYAFMDYVFNPKYKSNVIKKVDLDNLSLDKELHPVVASIVADGDMLKRTKPIFKDSKVMYEPAPTVDAEFRDEMEIILRPTSKSIITHPQSGTTLYTPDELIKSGDFAKGKEMAVKFFEHPVVQNSYKHNQELAKRFGITIPDKQAAEVVKQPVLVNYRKLDGNEIAQVSRRYYGDPNTEITMDWSYYPIKDLRQAIIHENLHRGWYSAPLRPQSMTQSYYNNTYKPEYRFWEWKTKKLLDPKYHNDWYLMDIHSGEAGPNFIDLGRDLGLKLGQKYPGYKAVKQMLQNYKGNKSFMIPKLNYSKAGIRHVWDAMTGKYFTIPTAVGVSGATITNKYEGRIQK